MRAWWGRRTAARCWGSRAGRPWPESAGDSCRRRDGWYLVWVKVCRSRRFWASLHSRAERGDFSPPLSLTCSAKGRPRPVAKRVDGGYVDLGSEPALWLGSIPRGYQETQTSYDSKTTDSSGPFCAVYFCTVRRRDLPPASGRETGEAIAEDRRMDPGRGSSFGDDVGRAVCIYAGRKEKQRTLRFWQTRLVAPREPGRRRQVSLGLVTMAETIQKAMSCFPGETGSYRVFDDKTVQGLDKRRRSTQKGLDTKRQQQQPRSYLSYPNNPTTNTPNATNLFFPKDLSGHQRRRVRQRKPGHTGRRIASPLPSACLVQHRLSFRPLSKRHNADSSRRGPAGDNLCASSPFARKHPYPDYSRYRRFDAGLADAGYTAISRPTGGSLPPTAMR